jgi:hypothetical protein
VADGGTGRMTALPPTTVSDCSITAEAISAEPTTTILSL